jgi:hypothetical protein
MGLAGSMRGNWKQGDAGWPKPLRQLPTLHRDQIIENAADFLRINQVRNSGCCGTGTSSIAQSGDAP